MRGAVKALLIGFALSLAFSATCFAWETNLDQALIKSKASGKKLFIMYGRQACGNCQHLKKMIKDGSVKLEVNKYIIVDLNCDDQKVSENFYKKYPSFGQGYLPFVVVAKPDGSMLYSRQGYGEAPDYNKLLQDTKK